MTHEQLLTWSELAGVLGVQVEPNGELKMTKIINACYGAPANPRLDTLTPEEQKRVAKSVGAALDNFQASRGG